MLDADAPRPHEEIVRYALARGVILIAASGNSGLTEKYFPAAHEGVIAVGAIDRTLRPTGFSTRDERVARSPAWPRSLDVSVSPSARTPAGPSASKRS